MSSQTAGVGAGRCDRCYDRHCDRHRDRHCNVRETCDFIVMVRCHGSLGWVVVVVAVIVIMIIIAVVVTSSHCDDHCDDDCDDA